MGAPRKIIAIVLCALWTASIAKAADIPVDNASFESPETVFAFPVIDDWIETGPTGTQQGFTGTLSTGVFLNDPSAPIANADQDQLAFIAAAPGAGISIYQLTGATYELGKTYHASTWVGKSSDSALGFKPPDFAALELRLFYVPDGAIAPGTDNTQQALEDYIQTVASIVITAGEVSETSLAEQLVWSGPVEVSDPWFGKAVGFALLPVDGDGTGTFNVDRVSLHAAVPGDFDGDGDKDDVDIDMYIGLLGTTAPPTDAKFDLDGDNDVDADDYHTHATTLLEWSNTGNGQSGMGTRLGDTNRDGVVSLLDLDALGVGFGNPGGWAEGDTNGDGAVTLLDLDALGVAFGQDVFVAPEAGPAVPEPASVALWGLGVLGLMRRKNRLAA